MSVKGFMEDWDGEIVISDVRNYKDANDFLEQATKYASETRGYKVPLSEPEIMTVFYNDENDEQSWSTNNEFNGEELSVYKSVMGYGE